MILIATLATSEVSARAFSKADQLLRWRIVDNYGHLRKRWGLWLGWPKLLKEKCEREQLVEKQRQSKYKTWTELIKNEKLITGIYSSKA